MGQVADGVSDNLLGHSKAVGLRDVGRETFEGEVFTGFLRHRMRGGEATSGVLSAMSARFHVKCVEGGGGCR